LLIIILYVGPYFLMITRQYETISVLGTSMIFVILVISLVGMGPSETLAQGSPGATVIWDNQDTALHTATSGNPDTAVPDGKFDTGIVGPNQPSGPVTMPTQPGDYIYFCTLHPFLVGTVTVQ
jgi:plastocyanin